MRHPAAAAAAVVALALVAALALAANEPSQPTRVGGYGLPLAAPPAAAPPPEALPAALPAAPPAPRAALPPPPAADFVRVQDGSFVLGCSTWYPSGWNQLRELGREGRTEGVGGGWGRRRPNQKEKIKKGGRSDPHTSGAARSLSTLDPLLPCLLPQVGGRRNGSGRARPVGRLPPVRHDGPGAAARDPGRRRGRRLQRRPLPRARRVARDRPPDRARRLLGRRMEGPGLRPGGGGRPRAARHPGTDLQLGRHRQRGRAR